LHGAHIIMDIIMTLEPYRPDRLDALALRVLDLAAQVRRMAQVVRENELAAVELHDRKALEWIEKLEKWGVGAEADLHRQALLAKSARKARQVQDRSR
jgi:hypothetical protein